MKKIILGVVGICALGAGILLAPYVFTNIAPKVNAEIVSSGEEIHVWGLDSSIIEGTLIQISCVVLINGTPANSGWEICDNLSYIYPQNDITVPHVGINLMEGGKLSGEVDATIEFRIAKVIRR